MGVWSRSSADDDVEEGDEESCSDLIVISHSFVVLGEVCLELDVEVGVKSKLFNSVCEDDELILEEYSLFW